MNLFDLLFEVQQRRKVTKTKLVRVRAPKEASEVKKEIKKEEKKEDKKPETKEVKAVKKEKPVEL